MCRLSAGATVELPRSGELRAVVATGDETSVICAEHEAPAGSRVEAGWCALRVAGTFDFGVVGVLARLASSLAEAEVPLLAVATFDTDYLLVKASDLDRAAAALRDGGVAVQLLSR